MTKFAKSIKNSFAKVFNIPFLFAVLFVLVFSASFVFTFQPAKATTVENSTVALNQKYTEDYLKYLALTDEEKSTYATTPRMYEVEFETLYASDAYKSLSGTGSLPTEYVLYNINSIINNFDEANKNNYENLNQNIGDQRSTDICWTFATNTALETTIYKSDVYTPGETLNFSELHLAYTTLVLNSGLSEISGGTFELAYEYLSREEGPVLEATGEGYTFGNSVNWASNSAATDNYRDNFYNSAVKADYTALESFSYPSRSQAGTQEEILDLRNSIKNHIKTYGAVTSSIYWDDAYYNNIAYYYPGTKTQNHMITLVGWDDNYTAPFIDGTHTGAYIAQNSWGTGSSYHGGYFYLMYDDFNAEQNVNGFVRVGKTNTDSITYNNIDGNDDFVDYIVDGSSSYVSYQSRPISSNYYVANVYKNENIANQYISRLKMPTTLISNETNFYVYYLDGLTESNVSIEANLTNSLKNKFSSAVKIENKHATGADKYLFTSNQTGYYTIDVKEQLNVTGDYFAIYMQITSGELLFDDNASTISQPYKFTYKSTGSDWTPYYILSPVENNPGYYFEDTSKRCVLPMEVQTKYVLGEINYSSSSFNGTYDGGEHRINVNVTEPSSYQISYSLTGLENSWQSTNFSFKDQGNRTVYFKIESPFYETVIDSEVVNIAKKEIVITPYANQSKLYGSAEPIISYQSSGYYETPEFVGRLSRVTGENVGTYKIIMGSLAIQSKGDFNADNYYLVFSGTVVNFTIHKRPLLIVPDAVEITYGETDPATLTYQYMNQATGETPLFSGSLVRESGEDAGSYDINLNDLTMLNNDATGFRVDNYELQITNNTNAFTILKRDLLVTPDDDQEKDYLAPDPVLTYTYSNNLPGQTPLFTGTLSRESGEDSGIYKITVGSLALANNGSFKASNYILTFNTNPVYFLITLGQLTGCEVEDVVTGYTGTNHYLNPVCTDFQGVYFKYSLDNTNWQDDPIGFKDVGVYTVYVKFLQNNYSADYGQAKITINKVNLIVMPNANQSKIYGETEPNIEFNVSGYVSNETPAFTGSLGRVVGKDVGEYLINQGSLALTDNNNFKTTNYNLVFNNSNQVKFAITPRNLIITPDQNQGKTYGKSDNAYTYSYSNHIEGEQPMFTGSLVRAAGENVGNYVFSKGTVETIDNGIFEKANYILLFDVSPVYYQITKADIIISIIDVNANYNGETYVSEFQSVVTGDYVEGDELNINYYCSVDKKTKKGQYEITATASNDNYNIQIIDGVYTVTYLKYDIQFSVLGEIVYTTKVEHFSMVSAQEIPVVEEDGYTFKYWALATATPGVYLPVTPSQYQIEKPLTFIAVMDLNLYSIEYNLNEGKWKTDEVEQTLKRTYTYIDSTFELDDPIRDGYTFMGWFSNNEFTGEKIEQIETGSTGNVTVFAKWKINTYYATLPETNTDSYLLIYSGELGIEYLGSFSFSISLTKAYSQSTSTLKVYVKWQTSQQIEEIAIDEQKNYVVKNIFDNFEIILDGININIYTVTFVVDGDVFTTIQKQYGQSLSETDYPIIPMEGKENFNNTPPYWDKKPLENIVSNEVVTAVFVPNIYTITFVMQDGKEIVTSVTYGEKVSEAVLKEKYDLGLFEYFVYDSSLDNISSHKTINVKIESNIYILYIVLGVLGGLIFLLIVARIAKRKKRNKFSWWFYAGKEDIEKRKK